MLTNSLIVNNEQSFGINITDELKDEFFEFWQKHEQNPLQGRDFILRSICPNLYGLFVVKLAVALVLIGGVAR
jgi:DNA helicase MCM9